MAVSEICDLIEERAKAKMKTYNIEYVYTDYQVTLQNPELDAIGIITWNNTQKEVSIAALDAGKTCPL